MKRALVALIGAAALSACLAPAAVAAPPTSSTPPPTTQVIDGNYYNQAAPWAARLFLNNVENCTATIIAPTYILTAKHCVGGSLAFRIGNVDQYAGTLAYGTTVTTHPSADLAIVRLDRSVNTTYAALGTSADTARGQYVSIFGWGATCTNQAEINCQSRYLKYAWLTVDTTNGRDNSGGVAIGAWYYDGITAGGDSGGPMFANGKQVGVASTSNRYDYASYTSVGYYRSWIRSVAGV